MAKKYMLVDDIDGSTEGVEEIAFNLAGVEYQLDLSPVRVAELGELVQRITPYLDAAIKAAADQGFEMMEQTRDTLTQKVQEAAPTPAEPPKKPTNTSAGARPGLPDTPENIRAWARANGWEVSAKGKIAQKVVAAFIAADNGAKGRQPEESRPSIREVAANGGPQVLNMDDFPGANDDEKLSNALAAAQANSQGRPADPVGSPGRPDPNADVEVWRAYARELGHGAEGHADSPVDLDMMNRSQIRTLLGIEQPMPSGADWGDASVALPVSPTPETSETHAAPPAETPAEIPIAAPVTATVAAQGETIGQKLQREAEEPATPLTPEQIEERALAEIAAAKAQAHEDVEAIPVAPVLPFRTP